MLVHGMCECLDMQMFLCMSCVHPVAVLNAAFCMTCSLLTLVVDERGVLQSRYHDCLVGSHECLLLFTPSCCGECFYYLLIYIAPPHTH